ncbi:MAG: hypothetical protein R3F61_00925 [Myxococcota bacterium]
MLHGERAQRFFGIPQTIALLRSLDPECSHTAVARGLRLDLRAEGLEHVPKEGPLVVAANHPFAMIDRTSLGALLERRRQAPVRAVVDGVSTPFVEMHPLFTFLGPSFWDESRAFLVGGGAMTIFPAGRTVWLDRGVPVEAPWRPGALKLAAISGATLIPAYVDASPSRTYHRLRRVLPREWVQKLHLREAQRFGRPVTVTFGAPLDVARTTPESLRNAVYGLVGVGFREAGER